MNQSLNNLVGRDAELALLKQWLADEDCRLVTLLGPGGIGKTRMALELVESWDFGLVWISLDDVKGERPSLLTQLGYALELPAVRDVLAHTRCRPVRGGQGFSFSTLLSKFRHSD